MKKSLLALLAVLGLLALGAPTAGAATTADCTAKIAALRTATESATFTGQNAAKDQAGLIAKLDAASQALAAGKPTDAIRKLTDFREKVLTLQAQGKVAGPDADALVAGADDAIACIQSLAV